MYRWIYKNIKIFSKIKIVIIVIYFLSGCTASIEDLSTLEASKNLGDNLSGIEDSPETTNPGDSNNNGGSNSSPGSGSSNGSGGGSGNDSGSGVPPAAPVISILNINSPYFKGGVQQDIIFRITSRVGAVSNVEYVVTCLTPTSTPEMSITTGTFTNTTSAVTIQNNIVSVGAGEDSSVIWNTPNLADVRCRKLNGTFEGVQNSFKIRITSTGENNLSSSLESSVFQIDSEPPLFLTSGLSCETRGAESCWFGGNAHFLLNGMSDLVTPVSSICVKSNDSAPPLESDPCWRSLISIGTPPSLTPSTVNIRYFLSFLPYSGSIYFWAKDGAGNMSILSNSELGTAFKDKMTFSTNGMSQIASSDPTFLSGAAGLYHETQTGELLTFDTTKTIKKFAESSVNFSNYLPDFNSLSIDNSGFILVKDNVKGLVMLDTDLLTDPMSQVVSKQVVIPNTGVFTAGPSPTFKKLKKHAIDAKGYHWFLDDGKLSYIDYSEGSPELTVVAGGGTDQVTDEFTDPKLLQIDQSDNLDVYGTFVVLPNQWVVFSAEDPTRPLNPATGSRFKLRVYKHNVDPNLRTLSTIYLSGSTTQGSVDELYPYSNLAVSYDPVRNNIQSIVGRFCSVTLNTLGGDDYCDNAKLIQFSISTNTAPLYLGSLARSSFIGFKYMSDELYMSDITLGIIYKWNSSSFQKMVGGFSRGTSYCANMSVATSCPLRLVDMFLIPNGNDQFLILDENYLRIVEQGQIFTIYSAVP